MHKMVLGLFALLSTSRRLKSLSIIEESDLGLEDWAHLPLLPMCLERCVTPLSSMARSWCPSVAAK